MTNYLTQFDNMQAYENSKSSLDLPNVSYIISDDLVIFSDAPTPPTPSVGMLRMQYNNGSVYTKECEAGVTTLTSADTRPSGYSITNVTSATIGDCVTNLGGRCFFSATSMQHIDIPSSVTSFDEGVFSQCHSLTSITLPSSLTYIGSSLLYECSGLTSIVIPSGVTRIDKLAFTRCYGVTSIDIPSGVTSIGENAFRDCSHLTSVTIPSGVVEIGGWAFGYCTSLTSITCLATTPPALDDIGVFNGTNNCPIYVPSESVDAYKEDTNWKLYASRIQAIPN